MAAQLAEEVGSAPYPKETRDWRAAQAAVVFAEVGEFDRAHVAAEGVANTSRAVCALAAIARLALAQRHPCLRVLLRAVDDKVRELDDSSVEAKTALTDLGVYLFNAGHVEEACGLFGDANGLLRAALRKPGALPFMFGSRAGARSAETISALARQAAGIAAEIPQLLDAATVMNSLGEREREADLIATGSGRGTCHVGTW